MNTLALGLAALGFVSLAPSSTLDPYLMFCGTDNESLDQSLGKKIYAIQVAGTGMTADNLALHKEAIESRLRSWVTCRTTVCVQPVPPEECLPYVIVTDWGVDTGFWGPNNDFYQSEFLSVDYTLGCSDCTRPGGGE